MTLSLKFAVVREDPQLEAHLIQTYQRQNVLCVASGGCTLLELRHQFPEIQLTGFDQNPRQIEHIQDKIRAVSQRDTKALNVEQVDRTGINQRGDFEKLFRFWRMSFLEFVATQEEIDTFFYASLSRQERESLLHQWFSHAYWARLFELTWSPNLLHTMFGPEAIQHGDCDAYARYFQSLFEQGLSQTTAPRNRFLQHILLGYYRDEDAPQYITSTHHLSDGLQLIHGTLLDCPHLSSFD